MRKIALLALIMLSQLVYAGPHQPVNAQRAQINYMLNCQGCHKADGTGLLGSVPSMRNFVGNFLSVAGGREFLVQVPGSANSPLSDGELAELLNWILTTMSEQQLEEDFEHYTEQEIARYRSEMLVDVSQARSLLVEKFK